MKAVSWFSPANRAAGTFLTDVDLLDALKFMTTHWFTDAIIVGTFDVSALESQRWVADGRETVTKKTIALKQTGA